MEQGAETPLHAQGATSLAGPSRLEQLKLKPRMGFSRSAPSFPQPVSGGSSEAGPAAPSSTRWSR